MTTTLETASINSQDRTRFALDKITQDITSTLYDGGGTANALEVDVDTDAIVASGAAVIDAGGANTIDVWLSNTTAVQNATFYVAEFSAATPTAITCIRITEVAIPDTDRTVVVDRANWGLTAATDHYVKLPVRISVTPGSYLMMGMIASEGGTWYARYTLLASMDASRADVNTNNAADLASINTNTANAARVGITQRASATTMHNAVQLDDSPTTATSAALDMSSYDKFMLYMNVDSTLSPTDVTVQVQFSDDNTTYYNYINGPFGDLRYEDTATASGLTECLSGDAAGKYMKVVITGTGTDATNYFTVTVKVEPYK